MKNPHLASPKGSGIKGFTLVELIVVISILAILATIAFLSFWTFQSKARDGSRVADINSISKSLELYSVKAWNYPYPDWYFTVTYSGGSLWYQWTVGDTVTTNLSSSPSKLSKKPTDPLNQKEYIYSILAYGKAYQIKADYEWDTVAYNNLPKAHASSGNPQISYIKWNYNWLVAKTLTGSTIYVLAVPSIVTSQTWTLVDVLSLSGKLLVNWQTNSGWISFTPTMVFSWTSLPTDDSASGITNLTNSIKLAYTTYPFPSDPNISNILNTTWATNITSLWANIITNYLGWSASAPPSQNNTSTYNLTNSLMFDSAGSQYLSRNFITDGNRQKWTISTWLKRGKLGVWQQLFNLNLDTQIRFLSDDTLAFPMTVGKKFTTQVFRDVSAFYHLVFVYDSNNDDPDERMRIYVNGSKITSFTGTNINPWPWDLSPWNTASVHNIWRYSGGLEYFDGYLADINFVDSGALDASAFWYLDSTTNQWLPKAYTGSYGTNGFHLDFSSGASLGLDSSWNNNTWSWINLTTNNQTIDIPINNFATLNPIDNLTTWASLQEGSLKATTIVTGDQTLRSTVAISSGKWYWETKINTVWAGWSSVWIVPLNYSTGTQIWNTTDSYAYRSTGFKRTNTADSAYWDTYTNNDIIGVAYDADNWKIYFRKGSVWQNSWDPVTGTNPAFSWITWTYLPAISDTSWATSCVLTVNFGQRPFVNSVPSGFKALSTANLPDPIIKNPKQYFDVLTYTGTAANQTMNTLSFQPDFVWIKARNYARWPHLYDSVRGPSYRLSSNSTAAEDAVDPLGSFNPNGFSVTAASPNTNTNNETYAAWNWKKWSALTWPGFDIVSYTGNWWLNTIAHNLWKKPDFIVIKNRDNGTLNWWVYHSALGATKYMRLNTPDPFSTDLITTWNNTEPTSTGFTVNTWTAINESTKKHIAYLWSEVPGFSKFGTYTGNGSSDGPFVYTGFRPRYVMIKAVGGTQEWVIVDSMRDTYNPTHYSLFPNTSGIEAPAGNNIDFLSNGFKIRTAGDGINYAPVNPYIYAAFAEAPFKYANAR